MKALQHQWKVFCSAVMFLTRIPVPNYEPYNPVWLQQSPRYFTWVGFIIGALSAMFALLFMPLNSVYLVAIAYTISSVLITGAFHEDGFADMCDAFGGGYTIERKLTIMKDSRIGTYGALGLLLMVVFKIVLVAMAIEKLEKLWKFNILSIETNHYFGFVFLTVVAHAFSRLAPLAVMTFLPYVADIDASKSKPMATQILEPIVFLIAIIPIVFLLLILPLFLVFAFAAIIIVTGYMVWLCKKHIGGYTGDCLGATQQIAEVFIYLFFLIYLKVI
jgi:adenosylcobinamide-GDP ribazoletransferase